MIFIIIYGDRIEEEFSYIGVENMHHINMQTKSGLFNIHTQVFYIQRYYRETSVEF